MTFWITPHTFAVTSLLKAKAGDSINLELDMLAKKMKWHSVDHLRFKVMTLPEGL